MKRIKDVGYCQLARKKHFHAIPLQSCEKKIREMLSTDALTLSHGQAQ